MTKELEEQIKIKRYVLPADLFLDIHVSGTAKLLYPIIELLDNSNKGCYASNGYLAALANMSERNITRCLQKLKDNGYIKITLIRKEQRFIKIVPEEKRIDIIDVDGKEEKISRIINQTNLQQKRVDDFKEKQKTKRETNGCGVRQNCLSPTTELSIPLDKNDEQKKDYNYSDKEEIAEADDASDEAENKINTNLYSRETLVGLDRYRIKDFLVSEGVMSQYDSVEDIEKYIEPEVKQSCETVKSCLKESEQKIEAEVKSEVRPKVKNGTTTLTHK